MGKILLMFLLLIVQYSYCQTTIEIDNQTNTSKPEFRISRISNPYSNSQELIKESLLNPVNTIMFQTRQKLEKVILEIENMTYSFYVEPNGQYKLIIVSLEPLTIELNEENSSINKALLGVNEQFNSLYSLKKYFDGTRENSLIWLHLGRSKNNNHNSISIINRNIKAIKKKAWYSEYNNSNNIDLYLAPYILVNNFKNNNLDGYLTTTNNIFQDTDISLLNPLYAESFKFFYGYSLRQYFMLNSHYSVSSANNESFSAFKKSIDIINKIENDTIRQLALLSSYDGYYSSYYFHFAAKSDIIEPSLEAIIETPINSKIKDYALFLKDWMKNLKINQKVPEFKLISYEGDSVSLSSLRGKYVYLDFWFSRCGSCIDALSKLHTIVDKYQDKVYFVSINGYDSYDRGKKIALANEFIGIKLHAGRDHPILKDYNIQYYPTYFLISPNGELLYKPEDYYERELDNVLKYIK